MILFYACKYFYFQSLDTQAIFQLGQGCRKRGSEKMVDRRFLSIVSSIQTEIRIGNRLNLWKRWLKQPNFPRWIPKIRQVCLRHSFYNSSRKMDEKDDEITGTKKINENLSS